MSDDPIETYSPFDNADLNAPKNTGGITSNSQVDDINEEDLRAFEQRLNILESKLNAREVEVHVNQPTSMPPNWPPFYPLVYYNIEDVTALLRPFVKDALYAWCLSTFSFLFNWLGCLALLGANITSISSPGSKITLSTLYLFIGSALSLDLNFLSVYRALKSDSSSFAFIKIFLSLGFTTIYEAILALGFEDSGSVGLISMLNIFLGKGIFTGLLALIATAGFAFSVLYHLKLLNELWKYFKGTDQGNHIEDDIKGKVFDTVKDVFAKRDRKDTEFPAV